MELSLAFRIFEILLGASLVVQTLEYLRLVSMDRVTVWSVLATEIPPRPRWLKSFVHGCLQPTNYRILLWLRLFLALALMSGHGGGLGAAVLFLIALLLLLRWRGAFNGGSDFMTLVCVSGLLLAHIVGALAGQALGWQTGLWYVSLQMVTSYFVSGWVKLLRSEWRSGRAMTLFLNTGVYGPLPKNSVLRNPKVARLGAWSFTLWEGLFPLALLDARLAVIMCAVAAMFHFLVFWHLGLNRFFWAWVCGFPAVIYCASTRW